MVYTIHLHFYLLEITRLQVYICQIVQMIVTLHNASIYIGEEIYSIIPVQIDFHMVYGVDLKTCMIMITTYKLGGSLNRSSGNTGVWTTYSPNIVWAY